MNILKQAFGRKIRNSETTEMDKNWKKINESDRTQKILRQNFINKE